MDNEQIVKRIDEFENNTLTALEKIVGEQIPKIATALAKHKAELKALRVRIVTLESRPPRVVMRGGPNE